MWEVQTSNGIFVSDLPNHAIAEGVANALRDEFDPTAKAVRI